MTGRPPTGQMPDARTASRAPTNPTTSEGTTITTGYTTCSVLLDGSDFYHPVLAVIDVHPDYPLDWVSDLIAPAIENDPELSEFLPGELLETAWFNRDVTAYLDNPQTTTGSICGHGRALSQQNTPPRAQRARTTLQEDGKRVRCASIAFELERDRGCPEPVHSGHGCPDPMPCNAETSLSIAARSRAVQPVSNSPRALPARRP